MKIIKITAGGASGAILVNHEHMFASPKQIFLRKTSFTKVVQSRIIVLFEKIFVRCKTGFICTKDNYYSHYCLYCFIQIMINSLVLRSWYITMLVEILKFSRGVILTEYYNARSIMAKILFTVQSALIFPCQF